MSLNRPNKRNQLLALLKARAPYWVSLTDIMAVAGVQYSARIYELRGSGHRIESKPGGGWFRLVVKAPTAARPIARIAAESDQLFPDDAPLPHRDLG